MFFAVVDRGRLHGSIRNGVMYFENRAGEPLSVYNFSINQDQLAERPYHTGMLHLLPRETFSRLELFPGAPANEWASEMEVEPVAKFRISPEDFSFLDRIGGHDDGPLVRSEILGDRILDAVETAAWQGADGLRLVLANGAPSAAEIGAFVELQAVRIEYQPGEAPVLVLESLPPAYRQILGKRLKEKLG